MKGNMRHDIVILPVACVFIIPSNTIICNIGR